MPNTSPHPGSTFLDPDNDQSRPLRLSSDHLSERDRLEIVREIYGRIIIRHDIEPDPVATFRWHSLLRSLPQVGIARNEVSALATRRGASQANGDDLVMISVREGTCIVRQRGREVVAGPGQLVVTRSADPATCVVPASAVTTVVRVPVRAIAPAAADIDSVTARILPASDSSLDLFVHYAEAVLTAKALDRPEIRAAVASHLHDLAGVLLSGTQDAETAAQVRGVRAARLRAIKADIVAHLGERGLSAELLAGRHGVSARYIRKLFSREGASFTDFVLAQRLELASRMLRNPRLLDRAISEIAYSTGFGDLSYFNRTFRRRFGICPRDAREPLREPH